MSEAAPQSVPESRPVAVIVIAAGLGTRMKSALPKVLHQVAGRPLLAYVLDAAQAVRPERLIVVTAPSQDAVAAALPRGVERAVQERQLGTGDAVRAGLAQLGDFSGDVVVLNGDHPLTTGEFVAGLLAAHRREQPSATVATVTLDDPAHYGRIVRDEDGTLKGIVEYRDATAEQRRLREVNVGAYVFDSQALRALLPRLTAQNAQGEYYLTDVIRLSLEEGARVASFAAADVGVAMGVNSRLELAQVNAVMRARLLERLMLAGVTIADPTSAYVDWGVEVGQDTIIHPQCHLLGGTHVGTGCEIGPGTYLRDTLVYDGARVVSSHLVQCEVGPGANVGPFTYLRPGTTLGENAKAGAFVEIKNSRIGARSKVPHLSYVGDADVGTDSNIACGNITANYDGFHKHRTEIGDHVHTGSDTVFVAPVRVGDRAYTAAGSVITKDIPPGALGIARERQTNVEGYAERRERLEKLREEK